MFEASFKHLERSKGGRDWPVVLFFWVNWSSPVSCNAKSLSCGSISYLFTCRISVYMSCMLNNMCSSLYLGRLVVSVWSTEHVAKYTHLTRIEGNGSSSWMAGWQFGLDFPLWNHDFGVVPIDLQTLTFLCRWSKPPYLHYLWMLAGILGFHQNKGPATEISAILVFATMLEISASVSGTLLFGSGDDWVGIKSQVQYMAYGNQLEINLTHRLFGPQSLLERKTFHIQPKGHCWFVQPRVWASSVLPPEQQLSHRQISWSHGTH